MRTLSLAILALVCMLLCTSSFGQGIPEFSTTQSNDVDIVELSTLNVILSPAIRAKAGADPFTFLAIINSSPNAMTYPYAPDITTESHIGFVTHQTVVTTCGGQLQTPTNHYINWVYVDGSGASHPFNVQTDSQKCLNQVLSGTALDASGYSIVINAGSSFTGVSVHDAAGGTHNGNFVDANGNTISQQSGVWTDTLGTTALTASSGTYTYADAAGNQQTVTVSAPAATFGNACNNTFGLGFSPITSISYPDGTSMQFTYEHISGTTKLTGRLLSVTLRTGDQITYAYSGGTTQGILCAGTTENNATMTRTTPDGTWTYTLTLNGATSTTKVTDPTGNYTVYTFIENRGYEIYRQSYSSTGTLLYTKGTCYNGAAPNCSSQTAVALPITNVDVYTYTPGVAHPSVVKTSYNSYGLPTERKLYDFGASTPTQDTLVTYGSYSGSSCAAISTYINDRPCTTVIKDGSGIIRAQTNNTYDSKGNLLLTSKLVSGSTYLSTQYTYNANGAVASKTDPNGAVTTFSNFTCGNMFSQTASLPLGLTTSATWNCGGGVRTSSTDPNNAVTSYNYVNGTTADPLWRLVGVTDPSDNVNSFTYQPNALSTISEIASDLTFGSSVASNLKFFDWQGKLIYDQHLTAPNASTLDTVSYRYDSNSRLSATSQPCTTGSHTACPNTAVTYTYDGLSRPVTTTDGNGGQVTYTYNANDVLMTWGPVPSGEIHTKQVQMEYNGLGQLVSLCRITNAPGSGPCGQANTAGLNFTTGYVTKYTYDTLGHVITVQQNAQGSAIQTRSLAYDGVGRLTSRTDPESGTIRYIYVSPGLTDNCYPGGFAENGDLHQISDANGNYTCYIYDRWHRVTDVGNNTQSDTNPCKRFRYDSASNGLNPAPSGYPSSPNAAGRLVEAATNCGSNNGTITDEWFAYNARGELTDVWELTPNSGGYYHTQASYAANGALTSIGANGSSPAWTYTLDGEGRIYSGKNSNGVGVSSVVYDASSMPTTITTTAGDTDMFQYDSNVRRMTSFTYTIGSQSMSGALHWNPNGTLGSLAITDGFYSAGTQTCNYGSSSTPGYDDLGQLLSVNCVNGSTTLWNQSFTYDSFGNITKLGSSSWMPGYNQANNQYQNGSTYDANGNLKYDTMNSYAWNVYNKPATIIAGNSSVTCGTSGTCLIYDAFDRAVEKNVSGTITQLFYEPAAKAIMSGQTVIERRLPLPGGATVDSVPGLGTIFWHQDWLGTSRLGSYIPSRTVAFDRAFAPYGEVYDKNAGGTQYESFTGDTQDSFAGLFDTPARKYQPGQGRWMSPDLTSSSNRYVYGGNNPLSFIDLSGNSIMNADNSAWLGFVGLDTDSLDGGDNASQKAFNLDNLVPAATFTFYSQACAFCKSAWGDAEYLGDWNRQEYMRGVIAQNQSQAQAPPLRWWFSWSALKLFGSVMWELAKIDRTGLLSTTVTLYISNSSLQHAYDRHGSDFGFTGNKNKETLAQFQQELEDIVKGPNTTPYTVDYRGQSGYTVFLDQPTGKAVIFDSNNQFVSAWELSTDQIKGVVVNGQLW